MYTKNGMIECSVCHSKLVSPTTKTISRAYDRHKSRISSKQRALNFLLVGGDCILVGFQVIIISWLKFPSQILMEKWVESDIQSCKTMMSEWSAFHVRGVRVESYSLMSNMVQVMLLCFPRCGKRKFFWHRMFSDLETIWIWHYRSVYDKYQNGKSGLSCCRHNITSSKSVTDFELWALLVYFFCIWQGWSNLFKG